MKGGGHWGAPRDEWAEVMDDIRRLSPDVIVTTSHGWARNLNAVISTIPIVVSVKPDRAGGHIEPCAGIRQHYGYCDRLRPRLFSKQLDLLLEAAPKVSHVHSSAQNEHISACDSFRVTYSSAASASRNFYFRIL